MHTHLIISGHVQGVGFRLTAQQKANEYQLKGWVRNKHDGTVEMEVEGDKEQIDAFIREVKQGFNRFMQVDQVKSTKSSVTKGYQHFSIK